MQNLPPYLKILPILLLFLSSCLKDLNTDPETIYFNPEYSAPLGTIQYLINTLLPVPVLGPPVADTINNTVISYDDEYYINPVEGFTIDILERVNMSNFYEYNHYAVSLMLRINVENAIPAPLRVQVYLVEASLVYVDSLFASGPVAVSMPVMNDQGYVLEPGYQQIDTYLSQAQIDKLLEQGRMIVKIYIDSYNNEHDIPRFYSTQGLNLQLGLRAELNIPITP